MGATDYTLDYRKLLKEAHADSAEARIVAEEVLRRAAGGSQGRMILETQPRDDRIILLVRLKREGGEEWLFRCLGEASPSEERAALSALFGEFHGTVLPPEWLENLSSMALTGGSVEPFKRDDLTGNRELLMVLTRVLEWKGESLIRFASCVICHDSKRLEVLRARLEKALAQICGKTLEELGLLEKPRQVLLHGSLRLDELDLSVLRWPFALSEIDIRAAEVIECPAGRVLIVENETTFLEIAKVNRDTLLIQSSYPNRAVLALLARLPAEIPVYHFGDTDPAGFDILRDLRERSRRSIQPLHMSLRARAGSGDLTSLEKQMLQRLIQHPLMTDCLPPLQVMLESGQRGDFEQESLGQPLLKSWPFFPTESLSL